MSEISKSALGETFDAEFEKKVAACASASEISELMKQRSIDMGLMKRDWDPDILIPTGRVIQPQPQQYAKSITVNGQKHILESDSEIGLSRAEAAFFRELMQTRDTEQAAPAAAESVRPEPPHAPETATDPVAAYLTQQGISMDALKDISRKRFEGSWADATVQFLNSENGADWPGGAENLQRIGEVIHAQNLIDAPDKVSALTQAYEIMKRDGLVMETPAMVAHAKISKAQTFEEIREAASSLFGRR